MTYFMIVLGICKESIKTIEDICKNLKKTNLDEIVPGYIGYPEWPSTRFKYIILDVTPELKYIYGYSYLTKFEKVLIIPGYHNYEEEELFKWIINYCKSNNIKLPRTFLKISQEEYGLNEWWSVNHI